jgi:cysteinyl-tRNA synthetase
MYVCGPTVYNHAHIGNARPIVVFDTLRRVFEADGYKVKYVSNFTDVDDKIINKALEEGVKETEIADRYIEAYNKVRESLNTEKLDATPRVTETMDEMIAFIEQLVEKGNAYVVDGEVYFSVDSVGSYGNLSHQNLEDLHVGARVEENEKKRNPLDFLLWKKTNVGIQWDSPWGKGRPGWHIECSAMNIAFLGETIDIHCGGQDLIFPHHENEIAQSECCTGKPFALYWMHNGFINVDNQKMSKSLGNFFTVRDVGEAFGYEPIRLFMLSSHYRSPINYSVDIIEQNKSALARLYNALENLEFYLSKAPSGWQDGEDEIKEQLLAHKQHFIDSMEEDFNTAGAISAIFDLARDINTNLGASSEHSKELAQFALDLYNELTGVVGLLYNRKSDNLDSEIEALIEQRQAARKAKNFAEADRIRDELKAQGIILEDTPQRVKWHRS